MLLCNNIRSLVSFLLSTMESLSATLIVAIPVRIVAVRRSCYQCTCHCGRDTHSSVRQSYDLPNDADMSRISICTQRTHVELPDITWSRAFLTTGQPASVQLADSTAMPWYGDLWLLHLTQCRIGTWRLRRTDEAGGHHGTKDLVDIMHHEGFL